MRGFLKLWLPVIAWMAFIFIGSTDLFSAEHTSRFIGPFLRWFAPNISNATITSVQIVVRKCGHLTEFAVLAALLARALAQERAARIAVGAAFVIAVICAMLDEFHQSFVGSRTGSPYDVAIDCAGAVIGLAIYCWFRRRRRNSRNENERRSSAA